MINRAERRRLARVERRDTKPVREGLTVGQLKDAEAELAEGAVVHDSSHATTMSVLAHGWFALDHQREASRMTYQRIVELRKGGRELKSDQIVQQYAEAKEEILVLETQIVELLSTVADEDDEGTALTILAASHMNLMTGVAVRLPEAVRDRFAQEAGLVDAPEGEKDPEGAGQEGEGKPPDGEDGQTD